MFSLKCHHVLSFSYLDRFIRLGYCHRNVSAVSRLVLKRVNLPRGKLKTELCSYPYSLSSASADYCCQPVHYRTLLTCSSQRLSPFYSLVSLGLLQSPQRKMAETSRKMFRAKHQKRQNRLTRMPEEKKLNRHARVSIQVTGTGTRDCPPSILVNAESVRFLFNCGEGTQRLMFENRIRSLAKLEHIFFTRMTWENLGGSIGMMITLKNVGLPRLSMYGPPELTEFSKALQIFAKHETIDLDIKPYTQGPFLNEIMTVTPVAIHGVQSKTEDSTPSSSSSSPVMTPSGIAKEEAGSSVSDEGSGGSEVEAEAEADDSELGSGVVEGKKRKAKDPFDVISQMAVQQRSSAGAKRRKTEDIADVTIAYICKLHDTHGRLDVEKVMKLGLKPGPEYGLLKAGKRVTSPDGTEIKPEDVVLPGIPGAVFIVLECPSEKYINSVIKNETFSRYQAGSGENTAMLVLHICPENILNDPRYQDWMQRFDSATEHIVFNESCHTVTYEGSRRIQAKLNLINEDIFPLLPAYREEAVQQPTNTEANMINTNIHRAESYLRYHIRPHTGLDRELLQSPSNEPYIQEAMDIPGFKERLEELGYQLAEYQQRSLTVTRAQYPEVVFFGTGSAMPNKERNVTGILLNLSSTHSVIMDCGEGTFGQMCRFYGNCIDDVLANLQSIFISHMHADHHVGLIQILRQWKRVMLERGETSKNLILVGPKRMLIWLNNYNTYCEPFIYQMRFIELGDLSRKCEESSRHEQSLLTRLNLTKYETVPVPHCYNSHGLVIQHKEGWKLVYSGDAMPSDDLIQSGKDADVLIHEATLEDGLDAEAKKKRHSMISQAIDVSQKMEAKFTILTHFSQRYPKIPFFDEQLSHKVGVAFDNMRVSFSELDKLPICLPALKHVFTAYIQEMQENRDKKAEKETIIPLDSALRSGKLISPAAGSTNGDGENTEGQARVS